MKTTQLLWVYQSYMAPNGGAKPHTHEYCHMLCIRKGGLRFTIENECFLLKEGNIVIVPKGCVHSFRNELPQTTDYYEIKFSILSRSVEQTMQDCGQFVWDDPFACRLVEHIAAEYQHRRTFRDESAAAALNTLLYHLTSDSRLLAQSEPQIIDTTGYTPLSKKTINFLCAHYNENLTLDDVSSGIGISKNYLCNAFKRNTGMTVLDCLNMIRVRKAAELIVYSDLPLNLVAQQCGYVSTSHFNRIFSHYAGIPPGQCRRAYSFSLVEQPHRTSGAFMYSVLAGKSISPRTINDFESGANQTKS